MLKMEINQIRGKTILRLSLVTIFQVLCLIFFVTPELAYSSFSISSDLNTRVSSKVFRNNVSFGNTNDDLNSPLISKHLQFKSNFHFNNSINFSPYIETVQVDQGSFETSTDNFRINDEQGIGYGLEIEINYLKNFLGLDWYVSSNYYDFDMDLTSSSFQREMWETTQGWKKNFKNFSINSGFKYVDETIEVSGTSENQTAFDLKGELNQNIRYLLKAGWQFNNRLQLFGELVVPDNSTFLLGIHYEFLNVKSKEKVEDINQPTSFPNPTLRKDKISSQNIPRSEKPRSQVHKTPPAKLTVEEKYNKAQKYISQKKWRQAEKLLNEILNENSEYEDKAFKSYIKVMENLY